MMIGGFGGGLKIFAKKLNKDALRMFLDENFQAHRKVYRSVRLLLNKN